MLPVTFPTSARIMPPTQIGEVVESGRYAPTANDNEFTPHSSMTTATNIPTNTSPHGKSCASNPLMMVAMSVACGAEYRSVPMACGMPWNCIEPSRVLSVQPIASAEVATPITRPICW